MAKRTVKAARPLLSTRDRMVAGAADLLRRRGVAATSLREVVRHTGTPRGSLGHHFPEGKAQLLEEAIVFSRQHVSRQLRRALDEFGSIRGLRVFADSWRSILESTAFEAGCPVMAVAIEQATDDSGTELRAQRRLLVLATEAFDEWAGLLAESLRGAGVPESRARSLAMLAISAFEGAIGVCRAARHCQPLDDVADELDLMFRHAIVAGRALR
ncbi:MAG TPA: helix-turn-helix domain-containing protein [Steroidobacteraceae bacterium]